MPRSASLASTLVLVLFVTTAHADLTGHENVGQAEIGLAYQTPDGRSSQGAALQPVTPSASVLRGPLSTAGTVPHTTLVALLRWPALVKYNNPGFPSTGWRMMDGSDDIAYYRDSFTALGYYAQASHDGETWNVSATVAPQPNAVWDRSQRTSFNWPTLTYYAQINGTKDCFYSPGWSYAICGSKTIYITAYSKSQCQPYGTWTMAVAHDGAPADSRQFTMRGRVPDNDGDLPKSDIATYNQLTYPIDQTTQQPSSNWYDNRCYVIDNVTNTRRRNQDGSDVRVNCGTTPPPNTTLLHASIANLGCFLTSSAMVLHYFGDIVNPPDLNAYLNTLDANKLGTGFSNGDVNLGGVARHANGRVTVDTSSFIDGMNDGAVNQRVCKYGPQIMGVNDNHHFVMVVGRDNDDATWQIYDPNGGRSDRPLTERYSDIYSSLRVLRGQDSTFNDPFNSLQVSLASPAELLVTAPDGRQTGLDPRTGVRQKQIPYSYYTTLGLNDAVTGDVDGDPRKVLEIARPLPGVYTIQVTGTGNGTYDLTAQSFDRKGYGLGEIRLDQVPVQPGQVDIYQVVYDPNATTSSPIVRVTDVTPPVTVASATPAANAYGWNNSNVTVNFSSTDSEAGGTGVKEIHVSLSGAQSGSTVTPGASASVVVSAEGTTVVSYYGVDNAGNAELPKSLIVRLDKTPPAIAGMPVPGCALRPPDRKLVEVATVSASDGLTGMFSLNVTASSNEPAGTDGPDVVVTGSGASRTIQLRAERLGTGTGRIYTIIGTATDYAGNVSTATATCTVPHDQGK